MHIGDRVENKINGACGMVARIPPDMPSGSIAVHQNDNTTTVWPIGDTEIIKPIADLIEEQEKIVEANKRAAKDAPTDESRAKLASAEAQLQMYKRQALGNFAIE